MKAEPLRCRQSADRIDLITEGITTTATHDLTPASVTALT